jgi:hypothetical protein
VLAAVEREARRRAAAGGHDPDMPANRLSTFAEGAPLWRVYASQVAGEIERLEAGGFTVTAPSPVRPVWRDWFEAAFFAGLLVLMILGMC